MTSLESNLPPLPPEPPPEPSPSRRSDWYFTVRDVGPLFVHGASRSSRIPPISVRFVEFSWSLAQLKIDSVDYGCASSGLTAVSEEVIAPACAITKFVADLVFPQYEEVFGMGIHAIFFWFTKNLSFSLQQGEGASQAVYLASISASLYAFFGLVLDDIWSILISLCLFESCSFSPGSGHMDVLFHN